MTVLTEFLSDARGSLRALLQRPSFTFAAVATLALGIGANTAVFSVLHGILFDPLPYPDPHEIVRFVTNQSRPEMDDVADQSRTFAAVGGYQTAALDYQAAGGPIAARGAYVSRDFFRILGARAVEGRVPTAADDQPGAPRTVVLSHSFWLNEFAADPGVVGLPILLDGAAYRIVGVLEEGFRAPRDEPQVWVPFHPAYPEAASSRGVGMMRTIARLEPGVSREEALKEMRLIDARLAEAYPPISGDRRTVLVPLRENVVGDAGQALWLLAAAAGLVLLTACANLINLLLARGLDRGAELALRKALGASTGRLVRQALAESVVLALGGAALGIAFAAWGVEALVALAPADTPRLENVALDATVLGFAIVPAGVVGLLAGLVPARRVLASGPADALRGARNLGGVSNRSAERWRGGLVAFQLALAVALLTSTGLLLRSFDSLTRVSPGLRAESIVGYELGLPDMRYPTLDKQVGFWRGLIDAAQRRPGIRAAVISEFPLTGATVDHNFIIEGRPPVPEGQEPNIVSRSVAGDYFSLTGVPVIEGRAIDDRDRAESPRVAVVNQAMRDRYFPGQDAVGQRFRWAYSQDWIEIVGVVGDVKQLGLDQPDPAAVYTAYAQADLNWKRWGTLVLSARDGGPVGQGLVRQVVSELDAALPVGRGKTVEMLLSESLAQRRFQLFLLSLFAAVGLALAAIGLYGVAAWFVSRRQAEIGVRMALGADRASIYSFVGRRAAGLATAGMAMGLLGSWGAAGLLESFLFGVRPSDPTTLLAVCATLAVVGAAAVFIPARRAASLDPLTALRHD